MHRFLPVLAAALAATGCGYIGGTQPPLANVPLAISDLAALQRGPLIIAQFTVPTRTTEGVLIREPLTLDLRVGTAPAGAFDAAAWAANAKRIPPKRVTTRTLTVRPGKQKAKKKNAPPVAPLQDAIFEFPASDWTGKDVAIAARVIGENGKESAWSNFVTLRVIAPPQKPAQVTAAPTANGVRLTWKAAGDHFRVFRKAPDSEEFRQLAETKTPEYLDSTAEYNKNYVYQVQTIADLPEKREVESDLSDPVAITPVDTFPPATPTGLRATPAPNSIELSWEPNTESDLGGYRIYRSVDGGAFEKIADVSTIPAYSDQKVDRGKTYRYAITAVDKLNHESERSAAVEAALQ